jgi:hypothetical protein
MSTIDQLAHGAAEALRDADSQKAHVAAHYLRVQLPELFRLARHLATANAPTEAIQNPARVHG